MVLIGQYSYKNLCKYQNFSLIILLKFFFKASEETTGEYDKYFLITLKHIIQ